MFTFMDVDEDSCLSLVEIRKMIGSIEKHFSREMNLMLSDFDSDSVLEEMAEKNTQQKISFLIQHLKITRPNLQEENMDLLLDFREFHSALQQTSMLKNGFLPPNILLSNYIVKSRRKDLGALPHESNPCEFLGSSLALGFCVILRNLPVYFAFLMFPFEKWRVV